MWNMLVDTDESLKISRSFNKNLLKNLLLDESVQDFMNTIAHQNKLGPTYDKKDVK